MIALCECGCGNPAPIAKQVGDGYRRGEPKRFIHGHNADGKHFPRLTGKDNGNWRGGRPGADGYSLILQPGHPRADHKGYVPEHVLVCEKALGKYLPDGAVPHHVTGKAGVKATCYEGTRHSLASQAINRGVSERIVGDMLGHKSRSSTRRYAKMKSDTLKQVWGDVEGEGAPGLTRPRPAPTGKLLNITTRKTKGN